MGKEWINWGKERRLVAKQSHHQSQDEDGSLLPRQRSIYTKPEVRLVRSSLLPLLEVHFYAASRPWLEYLLWSFPFYINSLYEGQSILDSSLTWKALSSVPRMTFFLLHCQACQPVARHSHKSKIYRSTFHLSRHEGNNSVRDIALVSRALKAMKDRRSCITDLPTSPSQGEGFSFLKIQPIHPQPLRPVKIGKIF